MSREDVFWTVVPFAMVIGGGAAMALGASVGGYVLGAGLVLVVQLFVHWRSR